MTMLNLNSVSFEQPEWLEHEVKIVADEIAHDGPLATQQNWQAYTAAEHEVWQFLYQKQMENLGDIAYTPWLEAINKIGLHPDKIPKLTDVAALLTPMTKWLPVPISGYLPAKDYFAYLSKRQFPTVTTIRPMEVWDFQIEPDFFHDAFGHFPMHTHPIFADFLQIFGTVAMRIDDEAKLKQLDRLYWFSVEYALIRENGKIKVCGSGHMSGFKEARYSLTDEVTKLPFDLDTIVKQEYDPHNLQKTLFVMDSYEQLCEAMTRKGKEFGVL